MIQQTLILCFQLLQLLVKQAVACYQLYPLLLTTLQIQFLLLPSLPLAVLARLCLAEFVAAALQRLRNIGLQQDLRLKPCM